MHQKRLAAGRTALPQALDLRGRGTDKRRGRERDRRGRVRGRKGNKGTGGKGGEARGRRAGRGREGKGRR